MKTEKSKELNKMLDDFLDKKSENESQTTKSNSEKTEINTTNDIVEQIDKKLVLEDGRQLLL